MLSFDSSFDGIITRKNLNQNKVMIVFKEIHIFIEERGKFLHLLIGLIILIQTVSTNDSWEDVHMICPQQCVCQYAHFMDLSIAKWINAIETRKQKGHEFVEEEHEDPVNENEVYFEGDESFKFNNEGLLKFVMCMMTSHINPKDLIDSLPNDVQALVLLYTGRDQNASVSISDFHHFYNLETLEIRGSKDAEFKVIIDDANSHVLNLNLDTVSIQGIDRPNFRPDVKNIDPSQNFHYVPTSEIFEYNVSLEIIKEDVEILPYEIYKMEFLQEKIKTISFYGWEKMKVLRISNCMLQELYWEMFDGLEKLEHLSVERNSITTIPPFSFYGALNIKSLSLAHNSISDLNYRGLAGLLELEILDLSDNNVTKLTEMTFPPFPKLEIVDIRNNPIKGIYNDAFGVMNNTRILYLGSENVSIEKLDENPFEFLEKLVYLNILNFKVPVLTQRVFQRLHSLEILKIKGTIRKIEFDAFAGMKNLRELHLSDCGIQEMSMDAFLGVRHLRFLDLSRNQLKELTLGIFDDQVELEEIYLENNQLVDLPAEIFMLRSIKLLRVTKNPLNCSCDMSKWKQGITNRIKSTKTEEKCDFDDYGNRMSCYFAPVYIFNHKFAPKCATPTIVKSRNLYYALRKILKCPPKSRSAEKKRIKEKLAKFTQKENLKEKKKSKTRYENTLEYQLFHANRNQINGGLDEDISNDISDISF